MRPNLRARNTKLAVLTVAAVFALVIGEITLRVISPIRHEIRPFHIVYSSPNFVLDPSGATRLAPNEDVRGVLIHDDRIVHDDRFHTNNMGLVDHRDYGPAAEARPLKARYAFVGNSFPAGMGGGGPWVPGLRDTLQVEQPGLQIYNLSMVGTDVQQWEKLLSSVAKELTFTHIVVLATSDDMMRATTLPVTAKEWVRFCHPQGFDPCMQRSPWATIIDYDASEQEILRHTREVMQAIVPDPVGRNAVLRWIEQSGLHLLIVPKRKLGKLRQGRELEATYEANILALAGMRSRFRDIPLIFLHLPERREVVAGRYALEIEKQVEALGFEYIPLFSLCEWSPSMFHPDAAHAHPNPAGHRNLRECVRKVLFGSGPDRSSLDTEDREADANAGAARSGR